MTPKALEKLKAVQEVVWKAVEKGNLPADIIAVLVRDHGARLTLRPHTNTLRAGGVTATCTWSKDKGLLDAWRRKASHHIIMAQMA